MVEFIEISLLPEEYQVNDGLKLDKNMVLAFVGALVLIIVAFSAFLFFNSKLESTKAELARVEAEIKAKKPIQQRILELEKKQQQLTAKRDGLKKINVQRDKWVRILEIYPQALPANSWLLDITEGSVGNVPQMTLKGKSGAFGEVGQFLARLGSDTAVGDVALHEVKEIRSGSDEVSFTISHTLPHMAIVVSQPETTTGKKKKRK